MIETLFGALSFLIVSVVFLLKKNEKLESEKKLNDIKIKDAKLEVEQNNLQEDKAALKKELKELDTKKSHTYLSNKEIEDLIKELGLI